MIEPIPNSISAFIVCCDEEQKIKRCLESVAWCDEIVVIDSGSTDATIDICHEYTTKVIEHPWLGYCGQKQLGLNNCSCEWVLNLDADEEVSPELRHSIERVLSSGDQIDGYELLRVVNFLGRWWRSGGWYPEYRLRLVRRTKASWGGTDPHEHAIVNGPVARLSGELYHYTYDDFRDQLITTNKFSSISATQLYRSGKRFHVHQLLINPVARFVKFYFLRKGHREGLAGLVVAVIEAAGVFLKYAKLWELEHSSSADLTRPKAHPATEAREPSSRQDNAVAQD